LIIAVMVAESDQRNLSGYQIAQTMSQHWQINSISRHLFLLDIPWAEQSLN
jgi:hypothetical protein